ncbi:MAG: aminotransferase class V-fold PLP-dependent enzyme, partial [Angelakisella sp.]
SEQNIDMLSLSAHKFHGPKGVGVLYVKKGPMPLTLIDGGGQEKGRRAGTENISGIVGLGAAITEAVEKIDESTARISAMRDKLIAGLLKLPRVRLNGDATHRLPGNVNVSFEGIEGESLLLMLDNADICASSGSACTSGSLDPSHVLLAIGLPHEIAHGSLRLSLGDENTMDDVNAILERVPPIAERLRSMSPVWERLMKE